MDYDAVPDSLRRLWRLPSPPARLGRKSTLDVETVVATAVRLADAGGLDAATLPRVAEELGVTAMSLYRYVGSKQELLQLMMDAASKPGVASAGGAAWREGLRSWAVDLWELYRGRPWVPRVPVYSTPSGPNQIAWLERGLAQLESSRLCWGERLAALTLLNGFARHSVLLTQDLAEGRPPGQTQAESEQQYAVAVRDLVDPERFPHTASMFASGVLAASDASSEETAREDFAAGLELVLDGLAARIGDVQDTD
ncbi:TetR/AcrR family transcriptional regulator [Actinoalloteichus sp. GBA129-24]|uniref:TetR/AcrR family transcriptional regulator n=1 Tax=Actinoalloteichus sp. GBA129-24 TaxID=1612551 RepID=UPI0009508B3E|nr:TetR/AcrR family transcriptional regulator [Actinoalloteichus sp. GBA129-24]APU18068.1 transcriptional regulator, TetR family [Actinoalloteichus sp. GBA129-24]